MSEALYTTILERQQGLGDVYFMSCVRSAEGSHSEVSISGGATAMKIMLVVSLMQPGDTFATEVKTESAVQKEIPEWVIGRESHKKFDSVRPNVVQEGPVSLEVNASPSYRERSRKTLLAEQENLDRAERVQLLMHSLEKNKSRVRPSYLSFWTMRKSNLTLCQLPFTDAILQYVGYDDVWHYNLYFENDLEMSVSVYVGEEDSDCVDFSIYRHGELIVANVLPMRALVKKMKSVLSKSVKNG